MFRRQQIPSLDELGFIVPPQSNFSGSLRTSTNVRVGGKVEDGSIDTTGNVVITASGRVDGTISAKAVSIQGAFSGIIRADHVDLLAGSRVDGKLFVKGYFTESGATVNATILHQDMETVLNETAFLSDRRLLVIN